MPPSGQAVAAAPRQSGEEKGQPPRSAACEVMTRCSKARPVARAFSQPSAGQPPLGRFMVGLLHSWCFSGLLRRMRMYTFSVHLYGPHVALLLHAITQNMNDVLARHLVTRALAQLRVRSDQQSLTSQRPSRVLLALSAGRLKRTPMRSPIRRAFEIGNIMNWKKWESAPMRGFGSVVLFPSRADSRLSGRFQRRQGPAAGLRSQLPATPASISQHGISLVLEGSMYGLERYLSPL